MKRLTILEGHVLERLEDIPDGTIHTVTTSPPYWGLRDYKLPETKWPSGWVGQHGLEPTPELYVEHEVHIFREVRRVLRADGTCWVNLGDCYTASGCGGLGGTSGLLGSKENQNESKRARGAGQRIGAGSSFRRDRAPLMNIPHKWAPNLKPKDMVGIPWRVAFALQADGWWLRMDVIWAKPNPLPESVRDRPTKSHEYIFLLTKREHYFFDCHAIAEPASPDTHARIAKATLPDYGNRRALWLLENPDLTEADLQKKERKAGVNPKAKHNDGARQNESFSGAISSEIVSTRNKRSVWSIPSAPYEEAHFATFPPDLVKPCILAGTSAHGCCASCGAPYERVIEKGEADEAHQRACGGDANGQYNGRNTKDYESNKVQTPGEVKASILRGMRKKATVDWARTCKCETKEVVPCTVLDPFFGSGTTGAVALELGRCAIGIELNPEYIGMAERRCNITPGLPL